MSYDPTGFLTLEGRVWIGEFAKGVRENIPRHLAFSAQYIEFEIQLTKNLSEQKRALNSRQEIQIPKVRYTPMHAKPCRNTRVERIVQAEVT